MIQVNSITIEELESKAKQYNKPIIVTKYAPVQTKAITVIDNTGTPASAVGAEHMKDIMKGRPMSRIAELEKKVEDLLERIQDLEDMMYRVLSGG